MGPLVAPLIAGGVGLAGSLIGSLFGHKSNKDNNRANMELAKYSFDRNLEMWNLQNEYNTPLNQRSRIVAAGLNPALLYGNGTLANTASNAPQYTAPHLEAYTNFGDFGMSNATSAFIQMQSNLANVANTTMDTSLKEATIGLTNANELDKAADAALKQLKIAETEEDKKYWEEKYRVINALRHANLSKTEREISNLEADTSVKDANADYINANTQTENELRPIKVENEEKRGKMIDAQAYSYRMAGNASEAQRKQYEASARNFEANTKKVLAEFNMLSYHQQEKMAADLNQRIYESVLAGKKVDAQDIENQLNKLLLNYGVDLRAGGNKGLVNNAAFWIFKGCKAIQGSKIPMRGSYVSPTHRNGDVNPVTGR